MTTRISILPALAALAVGCSSPPAGAPGSAAAPDAGSQVISASVGDTLRIPVGRSASVDNGRLVLRFVSRGADSRCPANVVCVWMGDAQVRIAARAGNASTERDLHTGLEPRSLTVGGYLVRVVGLLPYPGTTTGDAVPVVLLMVERQ
jgi:hypothetical protein